MLSFIWSLFNLLLISFSLFTFHKRIKRGNKFILFGKRMGINCYSCGDDIELDPNILHDRVINKVECFTLCKSCNRDEKLSYFIYENNNHKRINSLKKLLLSDRFKNLNLIILIFIPVILFSHFVLSHFFNIHFLIYINYSIFTIYWIVILYKNSLYYKNNY